MTFCVAVVGAGRWGRVLIDTVDRLAELRLGGVVTTRADFRAPAGQGCTVFRDWRTMLDDASIQGVIVASPPDTHYPIASAALGAGKAVLVEKPLTLSVDEAERLLAQTRACAGRVLVDHTHLFNPAYRRMRRLLDDAGTIRAIASLGGAPGPFRLGHPVLWDWAAHDVAICLDLLGTDIEQLTVVDAREEDRAEGPGGYYNLKLVFRGGAQARIETGNLLERKQRRVEVRTDERSFVFDDLAHPKLTWTSAGEDPADPIARDSGADDELPVDCLLKHFANLGESSSGTLDSLELGVDVVRVLAQVDDLLVAATRTQCQ